MQALLTILIVILTCLQFFVAGRIIDHDSFAVMIDDDIAGRTRERNPILSSISPSSISNGSTVAPNSAASTDSLAAPASVGITPNESLLKNLSEVPSNSWANESSASSILATIRSANNAANLQHKPTTANETTNTKPSRGYLHSKSGRPVDKRPSAISIVEEDLLVVPMPNGGEAIAYDISAVDGYGHEYRAGMRSVPGLKPVLSVVQPSLNPDTWLTFQGSDLVDSQPELSSRDHVNSAADDLARISSADSANDFTNDMSQMPLISDRMENAGDVWVKKPSSIKGAGQDQDSTLRRSDGRHFVHIRDDAQLQILNSGHGESRDEQTHEGREDHKNQRHNGRGEHKKPERRQPIRKHADEWRCLETGIGDGDRVEKLVCPPGLMITSFGLASLGNPQGTCNGQGSRQPGSCHFDLSPTLPSRCIGKSVCDIESIRATDIQNHCPGYDGGSRAVIEYQCSPWMSKPTTGNSTIEHCQQVLNNGTLKCPEGQAILGFGFGFFGEIDGSCSKGISPGVCSRNVMTDLTTQCVGRNQCRVDVNSKQFGSTCSNSTAPFSLAASFKCGSLADVVSNSTKMGNQSYVSGSLQFAKGNGAEAKQSFTGALAIVIGIIFFII